MDSQNCLCQEPPAFCEDVYFEGTLKEIKRRNERMIAFIERHKLSSSGGLDLRKFEARTRAFFIFSARTRILVKDS